MTKRLFLLPLVFAYGLSEAHASLGVFDFEDNDQLIVGMYSPDAPLSLATSPTTERGQTTDGEDLFLSPKQPTTIEGKGGSIAIPSRSPSPATSIPLPISYVDEGELDIPLASSVQDEEESSQFSKSLKEKADRKKEEKAARKQARKNTKSPANVIRCKNPEKAVSSPNNLETISGFSVPK